MTTDVQKYRAALMSRLHTILRRTRHYPQKMAIGGTMMDGKPCPPVAVSEAWTINSPTHGWIGYVLRTTHGYRSCSVTHVWEGCWHSNRDLCRDWYAIEWFYNHDAPEWRDKVRTALEAVDIPLSFNNEWAIRLLYNKGTRWQDAVTIMQQEQS